MTINGDYHEKHINTNLLSKNEKCYIFKNMSLPKVIKK